MHVSHVITSIRGEREREREREREEGTKDKEKHLVTNVCNKKYCMLNSCAVITNFLNI